MADKDVIISEKVQNVGIFNFKDMYAYAFSWFQEEEYGLVEEKYKEKVAGDTREIEIVWNAEKKISDYFKIQIKIEYLLVQLKDIEVEIDGKKSKTNKGELEMKIKGVLIKDPNSSWDASPLTVFLRDIYSKYVVPGRIEAMEDKVFEDVQDLRDQMKEFFELSSSRDL
jgi:hypothetical protein